MINRKLELKSLKNVLTALFCLAYLTSAAPAMAAKNESNGYKPSGQESGSKKNRSGKKANNRNNENRETRQKKNKNANSADDANKSKPRAASPKKQAHNQPPHKKKKHTKDKLKAFLKDTLEFLDEGNKQGHYNHNQPRHYSKPHRTYRDDYPPHYRDHYTSCVPHHIIKKRLYQNGWHDFELLNEGEYRTRLLANNHEDYRFKIVIDNCTGKILKVFPVEYY